MSTSNVDLQFSAGIFHGAGFIFKHEVKLSLDLHTLSGPNIAIKQISL